VNGDFEAGNLSSWTVSGSVSVVPDGPAGYFAQLSSNANLYTAPIDITSNAQTLTFEVGPTGSGCVYVYALTGPTYSSSKQLDPACATTEWRTHVINVTGWAGQSIKLRLRSIGTTMVDNVGVMRVAFDQWDVSGSDDWIPELLPDGLGGYFGRVPNALAPTTGAFQVPAGSATLSFNRRVASGGIYNVYVRCGPTFARCGRIVTNDNAGGGEWFTKEVSLAAWQGQVIKVEFYNAGTFDIDSVEVSAP
jgi:hypothetical protein